MIPRVLAIMPCMGRYEQTFDVIARLQKTADFGAWHLSLVADGDRAFGGKLAEKLVGPMQGVHVVSTERPTGYWESLAIGAASIDSELIVNLANDLLPGRSWLQRAVKAFDERYRGGEGMIGFNDGIHEGRHAAHFLISRSMLRRWYHSKMWPTVYHHNYGDTEITRRAMQEGKFAVAPWAVLYHNHPITANQTDEVYALGLKHWRADERLFNEMLATGWPSF
jgi:hypothetical protein